MFVLGFVLGFFIIAIIIFTSAGIKKRVIDKMLSRQEDSIRMQYRNPLITCEHVDIEKIFSVGHFLPIFVILIKASVQLDSGNGWHDFFMYYSFAILVFCLSDTILFLIRMAVGCIQGAILFDEKEERFYVFPSITSNLYKYKEYPASNLFYLIENYTGVGYEKGVVYVFFTKEENAYAFKINGKKHPNIDELILQQPPINMSIPFKYQFHTKIPGYISLIIALLVGILVFSL